MVTNREIEQANATRTKRLLNRVLKIIDPLIGPLSRWVVKPFPHLRSRVAESLGGRSGTVFSLQAKKQFAKAFRLALDGVAHCETHESAFGMHKMYWWIFLESAARSATELGGDERQQVLARISSAPEPGGLLEAQCLETFSRWRWTAGDADGAVELSRRAVQADPTWPPGHITLAWYGLTTGKFDPLPSLREALRVSPTSLAEIRTNPDFARFPELIAALEQGGREP
jgi:hypothetical protein